MKIKECFYTLGFISLICGIIIFSAGCAQISAPTGGPRDTIPPKLVEATPALNTINFNSKKITLTFDEYIQVQPQDIQTNVQVSPLPKINPSIDFKFKTVTIKLKDTLQPNTTYAINFGNAIRDLNEGNPYKNFTYVFSTGNKIDTLSFSGKVIAAENGKPDSTLTAMLYHDTDDSSVTVKRPDYMSKLNGDGTFKFINLPSGIYKIYALKDGDGGKTYNSKSEMFAFLDSTITISANTSPVILYAFLEEKEKPKKTTSTKTVVNKKLTFTSSVTSQNQDLLNNLELEFNNPLKKFDSTKIVLTDTGYKPINDVKISIDSTKKKIRFAVKWQEDMPYRLIINPAAVADSAGISITKIDTLRFTTKKESDYGNVILHFSNLDFNKNLVLQFVEGDEVKESFAITSKDWNKKLFPPGEYELRILFDSNKNGKWDPGKYSKKLQPEKVIVFPQKLSIRANWDNEQDIKL